MSKNKQELGSHWSSFDKTDINKNITQIKVKLQSLQIQQMEGICAMGTYNKGVLVREFLES